MEIPSFREHIRRTAHPFLIFTSALLGVLTVSWFIFPFFARVEVGGELRDADGIRSYHQEVKDHLQNLETQREAFVLSPQDPLYGALKDKKRTRSSFHHIRTTLENIAQNIVSDRHDSVSLDSVRYDGLRNAVRITGVVRNVGPRSMTVVAQLVDAMVDMPFVDSVEHPTFVRNEDPDIGFYSPFTITLFYR